MDPLDWLKVLSEALDKRAVAVAEAEAWYDGDHPIPDPPLNTAASSDREARAAFAVMAKMAVTNFLAPVVDLPASKLRIEGFRFSTSATSSDADLWAIFRRNHLTSDAPLANLDAVKTGQSFAIVWPDADGKAQITMEDPSSVIVAYAAGSRRTRAAALKRWVDDDGYVCATVYLPSGLYKYRAAQKRSEAAYAGAMGTEAFRASWVVRQPDGEAWPVPNPLGVVPVVEIRVNSTLKASRFGGGRPQFWKVLTDQKRINQTVMSRLVMMENQSFRQRWATGWDYPTNPDGTPDKAALQKASAARLWTFEDENVKVGEFAQADFSPVLKAVQEDVKVIASSTSTPPYAFLLGDMVNIAADALARIDGSHRTVCISLADQVDEAWSEIMQLALKAENDERAADGGISTVWGEFEQRTATEQAALATTKKDLGAPAEVVFATLPDVDQAEARRWVLENDAAALTAEALAP